MFKITVIGTGYVGLVASVGFAEMGHLVLGMDCDRAKVERLNRGEVPIYEPGLDTYLERNLREKRLRFTTSLQEAVAHGEMIFLCLPTPPREDGGADLSQVLAVAEQIAGDLARSDGRSYRLVVNRSTAPVGTAERLQAIFKSFDLQPGRDFDVVANPEFLREGRALEDFLWPERVVIGTSSPRAAEIMGELYGPFVRNANPILFMDERSAEMTKYAANAFLATKISFINEIANLCERVGANVDWVRIGMGTDSRIGKQFLYPGIGFGGSCFPKDLQALKRLASEHGYEFALVEAVLKVNARQRRRLVEKIRAYFGELRGRRLALWGFSFKPNTDDVREAPAFDLIREFLREGAQVVVYDPEAMENARRVFGEAIEYAGDMYGALEGADALVIATEWGLFRNPDFGRVKALLKRPVIFDGRNLYDLEEIKRAGFVYFSIGRPDVSGGQGERSGGERER